MTAYGVLVSTYDEALDLTGGALVAAISKSVPAASPAAHRLPWWRQAQMQLTMESIQAAPDKLYAAVEYLSHAFNVPLYIDVYQVAPYVSLFYGYPPAHLDAFDTFVAELDLTDPALAWPLQLGVDVYDGSDSPAALYATLQTSNYPGYRSDGGFNLHTDLTSVTVVTTGGSHTWNGLDGTVDVVLGSVTLHVTEYPYGGLTTVVHFWAEGGFITSITATSLLGRGLYTGTYYQNLRLGRGAGDDAFGASEDSHVGSGDPEDPGIVTFYNQLSYAPSDLTCGHDYSWIVLSANVYPSGVYQAVADPGVTTTEAGDSSPISCPGLPEPARPTYTEVLT